MDVDILQSPWYSNSDKHLQRDLEYGRKSSNSAGNRKSMLILALSS